MLADPEKFHSAKHVIMTNIFAKGVNMTRHFAKHANMKFF